DESGIGIRCLRIREGMLRAAVDMQLPVGSRSRHLFLKGADAIWRGQRIVVAVQREHLGADALFGQIVRLQQAVHAYDAANVGTASRKIEYTQPAEAEADCGDSGRIDLLQSPNG